MFSLDLLSDDSDFFGYNDWGSLKIYGRPNLEGEPNPIRARLGPSSIDFSGIIGMGSFLGLNNLYVLSMNSTKGLSLKLSHTRPDLPSDRILLALHRLPTSKTGLVSGEVWRDGDTLKIVP